MNDRPKHLDYVRAMVWDTDDQWVQGLYVPRAKRPNAHAPESADWVVPGLTVADQLRQDVTLVVSETVERVQGVAPDAQAVRVVAEWTMADNDPDPRWSIVLVRTAPVPGGGPQLHHLSDADGLTWETYGEEHNFGTDRMLEIRDIDDRVIATYAPGTWLGVCYAAFLHPEPVKFPDGGTP